MTRRERLLLLAARREVLVQRAALQRLEFAYAMTPLERGWVWVERGFAVWRTLREHPLLVFFPVAVVAALRPRGVLRLVAGAATAWRVASSVQRLLSPGRAR
jgi:hypothetical protein